MNKMCLEFDIKQSKLGLKFVAALNVAFKAHEKQKRKNGEDYIQHCIRVANATMNCYKNSESVGDYACIAILHDTIEDTDTKSEELEELFGKKIRRLVEEVTDDKSLPKDERKRRQIEHANELSSDAALIKLGDKISNVLDVTNNPPANWDIERRQDYFDWAEAVVNNLPKINPALEDYFSKVVETGREKL